MNTETLKQIVDVINHLGDNAKDGFFTYLAIHYGTDLLENLMGFGFAVFFVLMVKRAITAYFLSDRAVTFFKEVRDVNKLGSSGDLSIQEADLVEALIREALRSKNQPPKG